MRGCTLFDRLRCLEVLKIQNISDMRPHETGSEQFVYRLAIQRPLGKVEGRILPLISCFLSPVTYKCTYGLCMFQHQSPMPLQRGLGAGREVDWRFSSCI